MVDKPIPALPGAMLPLTGDEYMVLVQNGNSRYAFVKDVMASANLPGGGNPGEALVKDLVNVPQWGAPIDGGNY